LFIHVKEARVATSKTGVYFDTQSREVVEKQPVEGIQLCSPGGEITPEIAKTIEEHRIADTPRETADLSAGADLETAADASKTVSNKGLSKK
jgi:hypothetical protein